MILFMTLMPSRDSFIKNFSRHLWFQLLLSIIDVIIIIININIVIIIIVITINIIIIIIIIIITINIMIIIIIIIITINIITIININLNGFKNFLLFSFIINTNSFLLIITYLWFRRSKDIGNIRHIPRREKWFYANRWRWFR